jgi:hypothetical protein
LPPPLGFNHAVGRILTVDGARELIEGMGPQHVKPNESASETNFVLGGEVAESILGVDGDATRSTRTAGRGSDRFAW